MIEEAGGKLTRIDGAEWEIDEKRGCVITNGILHNDVLNIVNKRKK